MRPLLLPILLLLHHWCVAQVTPSPQATINYRMAGFQIPEIKNTTKYIFHVAQRHIEDRTALTKQAFTHTKANSNQCIIMLPSFGMEYSWYVSSTNKDGKEIEKTPVFYFSTGRVPYVDTTRTGLLVLTNTKHHNDLFLLVDGVLVMYDMNGSPLWYMPDVPQIEKRDMTIRDFKPTPDGTFTFMTPKGAYEVDYNGRIIWQAPDDGKVSGGKTESYHHEFTKLNNGHYLIAGAEAIVKRIPGQPTTYFAEDDTSVKKGKDGSYYKQITSGTIIEYDAAGNVVWSWKSSQYFNDNDYFWPKTTVSKPYDGNTYLNALELDAANHIIYASFKNINRILKIAYPSGEVISSYGETGAPYEHMSPFYGQHSCRVNPRTGDMYVYNNNHNDFEPVFNWQLDANGYLISHVAIYKQGQQGNHELKKVWDFPCKLMLDKTVPQVSIRGGSVNILNDDCVLVNMGTMNHMMILNKNKELVWDAAPYTTDATQQKMAMIPYRCNYIYRKDIVRFVFRKGS